MIDKDRFLINDGVKAQKEAIKHSNAKVVKFDHNKKDEN